MDDFLKHRQSLWLFKSRGKLENLLRGIVLYSPPGQEGSGVVDQNQTWLVTHQEMASVPSQ